MEVMRIQSEIHDQQRIVLQEKYQEEREKEKQKREDNKRKVSMLNIQLTTHNWYQDIL